MIDMPNAISEEKFKLFGSDTSTLVVQFYSLVKPFHCTLELGNMLLDIDLSMHSYASGHCHLLFAAVLS